MFSTATECSFTDRFVFHACLLSLLSSPLFSCRLQSLCSSSSFGCCVSFVCRLMEATRVEESPALVRERLSIRLLRLFSKCLLFLSALSSHPLFSVFAVAALVAALYLPPPLLPLLLSPVTISTLLLLAALFRLGSPPPKHPAADNGVDGLAPLPPEPKPEFKAEPVDSGPKMIFYDALVDRGRLAGPLEVIYEEYEGEADEEAEDVAGGGLPGWPIWLQYPVLDDGRPGPFRFTYADSDTESDSGSPEESGAERWSSPEEIRSRWEEEEEEEEEADDMIEIELEEENLIEIDITGGR